MTTAPYPSLVAASRLTEGETSREPQNLRAIKWLLDQPGGSVVVVTPQRQFSGDSLKRLVAQPGVTHLTWRGFHGGSLHGCRVLYARPDRQHLNDLWGSGADALVVIEWNESETAEWIDDAKPVQLLDGRALQTPSADDVARSAEPLPNGVDGILEYVAGMAAGYSSGLKWNEEDMLKADMMTRPERWVSITVEQVRTKCRQLGMRPNDVDAVSGFLQRRKDSRRFNVRCSYRTFHFE